MKGNHVHVFNCQHAHSPEEPFFAATLFLAIVSIILLYLCGGLTIVLCGIGAVISLIGAICTIRRPVGLTVNLISLFANVGAVGLAWWFMSFLP